MVALGRSDITHTQKVFSAKNPYFLTFFSVCRYFIATYESEEIVTK